MPAAADMKAPCRHCILGTAGHIDHGKSALVQALTGVDPDRLPEEKARGMTIDLGFALLRLADPTGARPDLHVSIVDVPGHERFIKNMAAGATGIDLALLVVAADDGVMPQTREHADILGLLGVDRGIVALNKIDLASPERRQQVAEQIAGLLSGTPMADWPLVQVSARTGEGLDVLRGAIRRLAMARAEASTGPCFRMAIDRVFAIHGRGTIVTGSVLAGRIAAGESLELLPAGTVCKVREVQSHHASVAAVAAGQRAAINVTGLDRERLERGMELATPGFLTPTRYVDARVRLLPSARKAMPSHFHARVCIGTSETMAAIVLVGAGRLAPGEEAYGQLRLHRPITAWFGQRFILRHESSHATLGGGRIVRPVSRRFRTGDAGESAALMQADAPDPFARYEAAVLRGGFDAISEPQFVCQAGLEKDAIAVYQRRLRESGRLMQITDARWVHTSALEALEHRALAALARHHAAKPAEPGLLRDRFAGRLDRVRAGEPRAAGSSSVGRWIVDRLLADGRIVAQGPYVARSDFRPALSAEDAALLDRVVDQIVGAGFDPADWAQLPAASGLSKHRLKLVEELLRCDRRVTAIAPGRFVDTARIDALRGKVRELAAGGPFKLADVRDALGLSRRAVQPLLEYLDRVRFTRRVGDVRVLQGAGK
jgi:selenocysteine-specific elongation factor